MNIDQRTLAFIVFCVAVCLCVLIFAVGYFDNQTQLIRQNMFNECVRNKGTWLNEYNRPECIINNIER